MGELDLTTEYDEGYFDKDEQGWVAHRTAITHVAPDVVRIRRWGDRNGLDPYDGAIEARVVAVFAELGLVKLDRESLYFDVAKRRLVSAGAQAAIARIGVPADLTEPARVTALIGLALRVATLLGVPGLPAAIAFPAWPESTTDAHFESWAWAVGLVGGPALQVNRRRFRSGVGDEVRVSAAWPSASVWIVAEVGRACSVSVSGALELRPRAAREVESFDWT